MKRNKMKLILDLFMIILIILLMNISFTGLIFHEICGVFIFILFLIHKLLNWQMIKSFSKNLFQKKFKMQNKISFLLDVVLLIFLLAIIITGVIISSYVFQHSFIYNRGMYKKMHIFLSCWFFILISIHIGFHIKHFLSYFKFHKNKILSFIIIFLCIVISFHGMKIITHESMLKNLTPNFSTNGNSILENHEKGNSYKEEEKRKYKNRKDKNDNHLNSKVHLSEFTLFDYCSVMILFAGSTYFILNCKKKII